MPASILSAPFQPPIKAFRTTAYFLLYHIFVWFAEVFRSISPAFPRLFLRLFPRLIHSLFPGFLSGFFHDPCPAFSHAFSTTLARLSGKLLQNRKTFMSPADIPDHPGLSSLARNVICLSVKSGRNTGSSRFLQSGTECDLPVCKVPQKCRTNPFSPAWRGR